MIENRDPVTGQLDIEFDTVTAAGDGGLYGGLGVFGSDIAGASVAYDPWPAERGDSVPWVAGREDHQ